MTKAFIPLLKKSKNAAIVNISSISAKLGGSSIAYSVSKAGVDMITKATAKELAKYKIRVNAISPGCLKD
jgi:3-oxoacyl-[acyl-carrier protein] reductase